MNAADNAPRIAPAQLSAGQFREVNTCLNRLADKLRVSGILLINSSGQVLTRKFDSSWQGDGTMLGALTASSYAAARELARLLGEKGNFQMVLHEGENRNAFLAAVDPFHFVVVVFEKGVALGMVRLFTQKTIDQLRTVLRRFEDEPAPSRELFDRRFQDLLSDELDRSFKDFINE